MGEDMDRRRFLTVSGASICGTLTLTQCASMHLPRADRGISWGRHEPSGLFDSVAWGGKPLRQGDGTGLLDGFCQILDDGRPGRDVLLGAGGTKARCGPVQLALSHRLHRSRDVAEDLLEATLELRNTSKAPCHVVAGFLAGARPGLHSSGQLLHLPISMRGMRGMRGIRGSAANYDCHQAVGFDGFLAHYLEPEASDVSPEKEKAQARLLAPVVDLHVPGDPCRVALFGSSLEPLFFRALQGPGADTWRMGRRLELQPGQVLRPRVWLLLHDEGPERAWAAFGRFGHQEDHPPVSWTKDFRVHYYDFLSAAELNGPRGGGYDADLEHFQAFHVGMATQHGYYLSYGDFIHPDRKEWPAMPTDHKGPVAMSLERMRARVEATRHAGVHPMIYLHYTILDEGSPLFPKLRDSVQLDAAGKPVAFGWKGPDVIKRTWKMSVASSAWRDHLVQQAQWVMELLGPDGIVLDETFTALGHDYHPDRRGPLSPGGIELMRRLRAVVRSFGPDKALFSSDCSMGSFCLWGDGEAGDHCYDRLLGRPLYRQEPVRYLAALGDKAWQPCAWLFKSLWPAQMDLARKVGAGVGVTNGWGNNLGLARLPGKIRQQMIRDIMSLLIG